MNKIKFRQVRDVGGTIDVTIQFLRQNFTILSKSIFYIAIPFLLLGALLYSGIYIIQNNFIAESSAIYVIGTILTTLLFSLYILSLFPIIYEYAYLYANSKNIETIHIKDIRARVVGSFFSYILNHILISLLFFVAYFICSLGVILLATLDPLLAVLGVLIMLGVLSYLTVGFSLIYAIRLFENASFGIALNRCFYLIQNRFLTSFGLHLVAFFISLAFSLIPSSILPALIVFLDTTFEVEQTELILLLVSIMYFFIILNTFSVTLTATLFRYFSLVEEKQAIGAIEAIEKIGSTIVKP